AHRTRADGNHGNEETSSTDKQQKIASPCFSTAFSLENHHDVLLQPCPKTTSTAMNSTRPDLDAIHTQYMTKVSFTIAATTTNQETEHNRPSSIRTHPYVDAVTKSSQATACDVEASMKTWLRNPWDRDGGRQGRARTAEIPTVSPEGIDF
ncbi:hypothetical protein F2P79_015133, partial [Pimephales promelas]